MNTTCWKETGSVSAPRRMLVGMPAAREVPAAREAKIATILCAASLVGLASTPGYAPSVSSLRLDPGRSASVLLAREEEATFSLAGAMATIKGRGGLTWSDVALIFDVTRRAVHNWVNGEGISRGHLDRVQALVRRIEELGHLRPFQVRRRLLDEAGVKPARLPATGEPAILTVEDRPLSMPLKRSRPDATKMVRI